MEFSSDGRRMGCLICFNHTKFTFYFDLVGKDPDYNIEIIRLYYRCTLCKNFVTNDSVEADRPILRDSNGPA